MSIERLSGRPVRLLTALMLTSALGAAAIEIDASLAAKATLGRLLAANRGLAVRDVSVEPFSGHIVLRGVTARAGGASITIGALRVPLSSPFSRLPLITSAVASPFDDAPAPAAAPAPAPAPVIPAPAAPVAGTPQGSTSADNVVITVGDTTFRIKRIDMTGTTLSNADLVALLDSKSTESAEARLKKFSAAAVIVPELLADETIAGTERHMSMSHILLANVVEGKAAAGSAGEISFALKDEKATVNGTTGAIEATALDLAQIAHVFGTVRTDEAEPIKSLYDAFVVHTIKVTNVTQNSTLTIAAFREVGAKARALKTNLTAASSAKPDPADPKSAALFDDMAHSFQIGLLEIDDLAVHSEAPDGTTNVALGKASLTSFADRKIGGFGFNDFKLDGPGAKVGIGSLAVGTFVIPPSKGSTAGPSTMAPPASLDVGQIDVDVVSKTEKTDDKPASTTNVKFKVDHVGFTGTGVPGEIPASSTFSLDKASFDVPPDDGAGFNAMGYKHVVVSSALVADYKASEQELSITKLSVDGVDMGSVDTSVRLLNVGKGLLSSDQNIQAASAVAMLVKSLDIKVKNDGLFQKAIAYKAAKDGVTIDKEREVGVDFFTNQLPLLANGNPKLKLVGSAIAAFITDPKTLHINVVSKAGLGIAAMGMLGTPDLILDGLDIQASANQ